MLLFLILILAPLISSHNKTIALRTVKDIERNIIFNDYKQTTNSEFDECEVFCLQPDIRLCQCSKEELNKYMTSDLIHVSKDKDQSKQLNINLTLPHIYRSEREKSTCGEYSVIIRKLNIAMHRHIPKDKEFYFEPTLDFEINSPSNHTVSNMFYWGDWISLYNQNPYIEFDKYVPGCVWQIPSGSISYHSTITVPECRNAIAKLIREEAKQIYMCVWSYERFWKDKGSGPCLCCELNLIDCIDCYNCFKNNNVDNEEKLSRCLLSDRFKNTKSTSDLSCYKCLNVKNPTFNCKYSVDIGQSYEHFLVKLMQQYQNKNHGVTTKKNNFFDF